MENNNFVDIRKEIYKSNNLVEFRLDQVSEECFFIDTFDYCAYDQEISLYYNVYSRFYFNKFYTHKINSRYCMASYIKYPELPLDDIFNINNLGLNRIYNGVIIIDHVSIRAHNNYGGHVDLEGALKKLQETYPSHLIIIVLNSLADFKPKRWCDNCIDLDANLFKPYPYGNFNRWIYSGSFVNGKDITDIRNSLADFRADKVVSIINEIQNQLPADSEYKDMLDYYKDYILYY